MTNFERTRLSSSGEKHPTPTESEFSLAFAFMEVGRLATHEERIVLSKLVVKFSFTHGLSRGLLYVCLYINHHVLYLLWYSSFPRKYIIAKQIK